MKAKKQRTSRPQVSRMDFVGTKMANVLELMSRQPYIPEW
jgi:hypothetical protein